MVTDSLPWFVARACGVMAWLLLCGEVFLGMATSTRFFGRGVRPRWLRDVHRFAGGLSVAFVAVQASSMAVRWLPRGAWRAVHSTSFVLFVITAAHVFTAGTDAVNRMLRATGLVIGAVFVLLVVYRSVRPVPERASVTMAEMAK